MGLFRKGKTLIIAKFLRTDLVICGHCRKTCHIVTFSEIKVPWIIKSSAVFLHTYDQEVLDFDILRLGFFVTERTPRFLVYLSLLCDNGQLGETLHFADLSSFL